MSAANLVVVIAYTVAVAFAAFLFRRHSRANPAFWFLALQWLIGAGTLAIVDLGRDSDVAYATALFVAHGAFVVGVLVMWSQLDVDRAARRFWASPVVGDAVVSRTAVVLLTIAAIGVTAIYYRAVGYNIMSSLVRGEVLEDVVSMRLAAYSGDRYFAPGYVNQFKNVLLPLGLSALVAWAWFAGRRSLALLLATAGVPLALWSLLGTGQRGAFVYAVVALVFGLSAMGLMRARYLAIASAAGVFLFGVMSFYIGRIARLDVFIVVEQVLRRVFVNEQREGLVGWRYIYGLENAWFSQWVDGLLGVLPGHPGSDLDHVIFGIINGTTRGTSTLPTVASVFYNGGWIGLVLVYLLLGAGYLAIYHRLVSGPRTVLRCLGYGALAFHLSYFVAGAPIGLVNRGVVVLVVILVIRRIRVYTPAPMTAVTL